MVCDKTWFNHLVDRTGDNFCFGIVGGSAFSMLIGMYNSPKGERLIRGSQAVRVSVPRCASHLAIWGGLSSVIESSMIYVRQKDDSWNSILPDAVAIGFVNIRQGLGSAAHTTLFFGLAGVFCVGLFDFGKKVASSVQSPQPDFEELDKKPKRRGIKT